jgi:peptide/nickel transport system substrate-binding protein
MDDQTPNVMSRIHEILRAAILIGLTIMFVIILSACGAPAGPVEEETAEPPVEVTLAEEAVPTTIVDSASNRGQGETLRLLYWQAPTILNPHLSPGTKDLSASRITYEPLASFNKDGEMVPFLAAEIPSLENGGVAPDGTSVIWKLKEGVRWADGEPFTADDVLFTYEYITNPEVASTSAATYGDIESVEVIDDYSLKINFGQPNSSWFLPFVGPQGMILPRHIFEDYNGPQAADAPANLLATGTGPYYVVDVVEEDILIIGGDAVSTNKITYEANPFFREPDKPFFKTVELQGGGDGLVALEAVKNGQVDYAWNLQFDDETLADMESEGRAAAVVVFGAFVERIMINFTDPNSETISGERSNLAFPHPFFSDPKVRQAVILAIDRQTIAEAYGRGGQLTANILASPLNYNSPNTSFEHDLEKARRLLEEAGWVDTDGDGLREKDGVELRIVFQTSISSLRQLAQEQVKNDLETVGFEVELKQIDSSIFFGPPEGTTDTRRQFYADLEEFAFSNKSPDPSAYMAGWTCAEIAQQENDWALSNWARYCNPEYDALYEEARLELDPQRRAELFIELNDLLINDAAVIAVAHLGDISGVNTDLKGLDITPWDVEVWNIMDWHK